MSVYSKLVKGKVDSNVEKILKNPFTNIPDIESAIELSKKYGIALHPRYVFYWNEMQASEFAIFLEKLKRFKFKMDGSEIKYSFIPVANGLKRKLEILGIEHKVKVVPIDKVKSEREVNIAVLDTKNTKILLSNLGADFNVDQKKLGEKLDEIISKTKENLEKTPCEILSMCNEIEIRDKGGTYIGARMGRPEKAKIRKLDGSPHGLFPIGEGKIVKTKEFGSEDEREELIQNRLRNIMEAYSNGTVNSDFQINYCPACDVEVLYNVCHICGGKTEPVHFKRYSDIKTKPEAEDAVRFRRMDFNIKEHIDSVRQILGFSEMPKLVKGIRGTSNKNHVVEHITKAFLRQKNDVYVNKDGTVRFDMIEMGLTHFKPKEIETSIEKLKELGYTHDCYGEELVSDDQLIEIMPQDVILPDCSLSGDELASEFVINTGNFVDDLLEKLYGLPRFYNFKTKEDTVGHLLIGLAPHTSAGIVGRILGYSKTQGCFSHPVWHAAQRRNLDGDENGVMLLLDGLINFSREYLPARRGAATMDTAIVLTSHLYLDQIDDEVHGMDIVSNYSLDMYRAAKKFESPKSVKVEKVENRIEVEVEDEKYLGYSFTHDTDDVNSTVLCSSYKSVPLMADKMDLQLNLGTRIRAVDENQVGSFIIDKHFMKDIKGNLRKFSMQSFRCTNCNTIFRRPPLNGKCTNCGAASINFTIHEGSIKKYLGPSFDIIAKYDVDPYIVETLELANLRIEGVFGKEKEKQKALNEFWG